MDTNLFPSLHSDDLCNTKPHPTLDRVLVSEINHKAVEDRANAMTQETIRVSREAREAKLKKSLS